MFYVYGITGNVHIEYRREDSGCGVAATMLWGSVLCCDCATFIVAPLNALGRGLSIWVKSIKPSEGLVTQKETASQISPRRRKLSAKAVLMEMTT